MNAQLETAGWRANLELDFEQCGARTVLTRRKHSGPLLVQRPFYPEGVICHTYLIHPPGGVVGTDELDLQINIGRSAHALITTPAAGKVYRSDGRVARISQALHVGAGTLEWLPQETIFYAGAHAQSTTRVRLCDEARFVGWEITCLGLPASQRAFISGNLRLALELWSDERPLFIDRLHVTGGSDALTAAWGWCGRTALGTLIAYPAERANLERAREVLAIDAGSDALEHSGDTLDAATLVDGVLVVRCLGAQSDVVKQTLAGVWRELRASLVGVEPTQPRIWAT